ncbi:MAG: SPOR domain-containing protein, partial [Desulfovibrionales bacterium]|nr:SPOR domain-containing protein [Desulfovibrionales bacterium]
MLQPSGQQQPQRQQNAPVQRPQAPVTQQQQSAKQNKAQTTVAETRKVDTAPSQQTTRPASSSETKKAAENFQRFTLLLGSYVSREEAEREAVRIANAGEHAEVLVTNEFPILYSVVTGKFKDQSTAEVKAEKLSKEGLHLSLLPATDHRRIKTTAGTPVWLSEFMSYLSIEGAERQQRRLANQGINSKIVKIYDVDRKPWFLVIAGQYPKKDVAENTCKKYT